MRRARITAVAALALMACGRTRLFEDAVDAGNLVDAGVPDAGLILPPLCPPSLMNSGRVWGTTPVGPIDFSNVWTGTEGPWGHSCPHITVFASGGEAPDRTASLIVDFNYARPPSLGINRGVATVRLGGKTATIDLTANVTRADGLTMSEAPMATWRTSLTFAVADAGWTLQGVLTEVPDCSAATWYCL